MFPEELSDHLVGKLVSWDLELDVFNMNPTTIDHFEDDFQALDTYHEERALLDILNEENFHRYSLGFYHTEHQKVVGQLPVKGPIMKDDENIQPVFVRVLPPYQRQGLGRAFIFTTIENVLNNEPKIRYLTFIPYIPATDIIRGIVQELDPHIGEASCFVADADRVRSNLPRLKEKYNITYLPFSTGC